MKLENKTALVTGGSRGLGRNIAIRLASEGANVIINYTSSEEGALEVKQEIEKLGRKAIIFKADISKMEEAKKLVEVGILEFGEIDILINNAGITRDNLLLRMSEEEFDDVIDINLKGTFNMSKSVIRGMLKTRNCSIINISSVVGINGNPGQVNYAASKAGVIGMTKSMAKEVARKKVRVNAIAPGFMRTEMTEKLPEETIAEYKKNIPLGELGDPEDISNAVVFLASQDSKYITGQVLVIDGGLFM